MDEVDKLISVFDFKGHDVRVVTVEREPWFVAVDVCKVLEIQNPTDALKRLDEDERARFNLGRQGETNIINEPGLYSLILGSKKPEVKFFKRWVTHEVLPSIRKTGSYSVQHVIPQKLPDALRAYADEVERREMAEKRLAIAEPKAEKHDKFIDASSLQGIKEVGKVLGVGQKKFFEFLRQVKIMDGKNLPMQDYLNRGWFEVKEATIGHGEEDAAFNVAVTKVTSIGVSALSDVVEKYGGADTLNDLKVKEVAGYVKAKQMEK